MTSNDELALGLKKDRRGISLIWVAPIVAVLITTGMIWKNYVDAGTRITIVVDNGDGIRNGKTPIMYKGIQVGLVENIHIKEDDVSKLELVALIDKQAAEGITRKGNKFWKVEPKISITEVSGLNTIISGIYISVMPAANSKEELYSLPFEDKFIALSSAPVDVFDPGLLIIVNTVDKGDIAIGAPVLYNKQAIGKVEDKRLSSDKKSIDLSLRIKTRYMGLVHSESIFYKADALQIKASLAGVKVEMGSFASFIAGGIGMHNTDACLSSPIAKDKASFSLFDNYEEAMLSKDEIILVMKGQTKLAAGISKVFYKGMEAGLVKSLRHDPIKEHRLVTVQLHKSFRDLANESAYFWTTKPEIGFKKIEGLDAIIQGNYLNFSCTNVDANIKSNFILHENAPKKKGLKVNLVTKDISGLQEGMGLFYHGVEIGSISAYTLNKDKKSFLVQSVIDTKYKKLVNDSSLFYLSSGLEVSAGLDGLKIHAGSTEAILRGGISLITPDLNSHVSQKKQFKLYKSYAQVSEQEYLSQDGTYITLLADKMGSLKIGSPVYYKQIKTGKVTSYKWDSKIKKLLLEVFILDEFAKEIRDNTLFYNASGIDASFSLSGFEINTESVESVLTGGISFYTPASQTAKQVHNYDRFKLYDTKTKAMSKYIDIKLYSEGSNSLVPGNLVMYKNVVIGSVVDIDLLGEGVEIGLKIDSKYTYLMKEGTLFWSESFEMSLQGIENFSAALKGTFIVLKPGTSDVKKSYFHLMADSPSEHFNEKGLRVIVQSTRLSGIKKESPVYFRQIRIGSVSQFRLNDNATGVDIELFIEPCYAHLIRSNSYFYNTSGIGMEFSLTGAKIKTDSLESILSGGIAVLTPDDFTSQAKDSQVFILNDDFDESYLSWSPKLYSSDAMCQ